MWVNWLTYSFIQEALLSVSVGPSIRRFSNHKVMFTCTVWCQTLQSKGRKRLMSQLKGYQTGRPLSYWDEGQLFCSLQAVNWLDAAHIQWKGSSASLSTQSSNLNINLTQKHPPRHTQNSVWPTIRAPYNPIRSTNKMNHRNIPHTF